MPREEIYRRFAARVNTDGEIDVVAYGTAWELDPDSGVTTQGPGDVAVAVGITAVDATFTYACGGVTVRGTVNSWRPSHETLIFDCSDDADPPAGAMERQARKLTCR
ncbi:hypothetical protein GCM10010168_73230 [Actinoplanes ianthinogenes]|uniref:Uncharacterized protein n=1 Tax=Actinoplanes ianthinogenes TaxID=122358 RepID=A0ABM7LN79_9ACTN|nr:hypothetical protein [Actinoplanes ianthinogenes]BCJ40689.1 hypothetical protein Aiant_13460 [Actinoplanes ianthinogenes]GGR43615.1 hypothetical protein GCM10010168_73230 [Actinoplanes ianthinogenes]